MNKKYWQILLSAILIGIGILLALTAASFMPLAERGLSDVATASPTLTPTIPANATSQPGSTDWITLMGVIIVLIVVIPVLFRWSASTKQ
jgi:hypothetical protein